MEAIVPDKVESEPIVAGNKKEDGATSLVRAESRAAKANGAAFHRAEQHWTTEEEKHDYSNANARATQPYDGHRGLDGLGGYWVDFYDARKLACGKEAWWKSSTFDGRRVAAKQHSPHCPSDRPVWLGEDRYMYLGEWKVDSDGRPMEDGFGICYFHRPDKWKGMIYIGDFKHGVYHGTGEMFFLESSPAWKKNELAGSPIKCRGVGGAGIPFTYRGEFQKGLRTDEEAIVTLKDGTTRKGPWFEDKPEGNWLEEHKSVAQMARAENDSEEVSGNPPSKAARTASGRTPTKAYHDNPVAGIAEEEGYVQDSEYNTDEEDRPKKRTRDEQIVGWTERWFSHLEKLKEFKAHNNHCNVPYNGSLGAWVYAQRKTHQKGTLKQDRVDALNALGFDWKPQTAQYGEGLQASRDQKWFAKLDELKAFKAEFKHTNVPRKNGPHHKLGVWVHYQRMARKGNKLNEQRVQALEALDFRFSVKTSIGVQNGYDKRWSDQLAKLKAYKEQHGHPNVPQDYPPDRSLGHWISYQRSEFKSGKMKQHRVEALEALGFAWSLRTTKGPTSATRSGPQRPKRSTVVATQQQAVIDLLSSSDSETEDVNVGVVTPVKREQDHEGGNRGRNDSVEQEEAGRIKKISEWISRQVIGHNPLHSTMELYAKNLFQEGFQSVELIKAHLKERHVESFDWMLKLHKELFLDRIHDGW